MTSAARDLAQARELRRFALFLVVGAGNTVVGYAIFAILVGIGAGSTAAATGSTILGALFNFRSFGSIVFRSFDGSPLPRFLAVYLLQWAINLLALRLLDAAGLSALLAQAIIVPFLAVAGFLLMRRFVFRAAPAGGLSP